MYLEKIKHFVIWNGGNNFLLGLSFNIHWELWQMHMMVLESEFISCGVVKSF